MSMHKIPLTPIEESGLRAHGLDIGKPSQLSDAFRQGVRYASAQLPSQGGEAVGVVFTMEALAPGGGVKSHASLNRDLPAGTKLYTHPADQVADDLTMVKVSRELLEQIAVELEHDNDRYFLGRELRALLEQKP